MENMEKIHKRACDGKETQPICIAWDLGFMSRALNIARLEISGLVVLM